VYLTNGTSSSPSVTVNVNNSANAQNNNINNFNITSNELTFLTFPIIVNPNGTLTIGLPLALINLINLLLG
jgi:hypothetical protein